MVVFNDEISTARNVTKTHTSNTNTFQSPNHGPLGAWQRMVCNSIICHIANKHWKMSMTN
ncbi:asparaginase domain-containing protein [Staphylococcus aureus]